MTDPDAETHRTIADACLGVDPIPESMPGLSLYRRLVRNNLVGVTSRMMPRTRARLNALASGAFDASFDQFLSTQGPRTHYLRDVPGEFLAWTAPRWANRADVPAYAADLAAHELGEFQVGALPAPPVRAPLGDLALDRPLVFAEAQRLARYRFAIHELPEDIDDRTVPAARAVCLLYYRDAAYDVASMEIEPLPARILEALVAGLPVAQAIATACREAGAELTNTVLADTARLLAELGEQGVLLGAAG
jgi:hypothetical protein